MNPSLSFSSSRRGQRGSAFVTVMMFTCVLFILVGSIIKWSVTERRLNMRTAYWLEARNAAEAVAEYGFAQIVTQFNSYATPPTFDPGGSNALVRPPTTFFSSHVNTAAYSTSNPNGMELIGGTLSTIPSSGGLFFVDPSNPDNQMDTLRGQRVYRRDIQVLARATVVPPNGSGTPITAYVTEKVSIRGAPLFAHAIFYSDNDLEASPGPVLDIYGPVHVNGNMFPLAQGTVETGTANAVNFRGPVSITGDLYHAWASEKVVSQGRGYSSSAATMDGEPVGYDPVSFVNGSGTQVNLKGGDGVWKDSTMGAVNSLWINSQGRYSNTTTPAIDQLKTKVSSTFRQYAAQTWGGNLQTAAMGVQAYHPISFTQPIDAAGTVPDPHSIIDPPDTTLTSSDPYFAPKSEVETQKFATQAGLYIQVAVTPGTAGAANPADTHAINLYGPAGSAPSGTAAADIGPNGGIKLGAVPAGLVTFIPHKSTVVTVGSKIVGGVNNNKFPVTTTVNGGTVSTATVTYAAASPGASKVVNQGMYDQRQDAGINLVQVDMAALRSALNNTVANTNADGKAIVDSSGGIWGSGTWNGGVYVEVKSAAGGAFPGQTSVALANGQVDSGNNLIPTVNSVSGLTVATNAPVYILGHFNADGANPTVAGSATTPDDGKTNVAGAAVSAQIPVAIAADAITILSPNYFGVAGANGSAAAATNATTVSAYTNLANVRNSASGSVEVAAAFITGIVATNGSSFSGGVHNLPRFLEHWGANSAAIRGSLVSLYKSKVATGPWAQAYYSAPKRVWGFDKTFENGTFPPLTPRVMSYRRVDFTDLNATTFQAARHTLWPSRF